MFAPATEEEQLAYELVTNLVLDAATELSTDVHIEPFREEAVVRYRLDGSLQEIGRHPLAVGRSTSRILKRMFMGDPDDEKVPQDGRILFSTSGHGRLEVRVSILPTVFGERVRLRITEPGQALGWSALGLREPDRQRLEDILARPYGLVIFSGPPGSGRSHTARAALTWLAERAAGRNCIFSVEEPVETILPGVVQTQVGPELPWLPTLKGVMRQDPDIVYCDQVPSTLMANQILTGALGGHLMLARFTALDAAAALQGFAEMGLEPLQRHQLLATVWQGVVAQRLARRICPHCKVKTKDGFYRGKGCEACRKTGTLGRTGVFQLVTREESLAPMLLQTRPLGELRAELERLGHPSLADCALQLAREGVITREEAIRCSA